MSRVLLPVPRPHLHMFVVLSHFLAAGDDLLLGDPLQQVVDLAVQSIELERLLEALPALLQTIHSLTIND